MAFVVACGSAEEPEATKAPAAAPTTAPPATEAAMEEQETAEAMEEGEDSDQQPQTTTEDKKEDTTSTTSQQTTEDEDKQDSAIDPCDAFDAAAAQSAGGPGSIYNGDGDFNSLVGPAPGVSCITNDEGKRTLDDPLGDGTGMVPLAFVEKNRHIFETDYYRSLIEKAKLTDPTPLTSSGEEYNIQ